jgi:hypothetical protein
MRYRLLAILALAVTALSACAALPQQELRGYSGAFEATREAGTEIYGRLDVAVARAARLAAGQTVADCGPARPAPKCFDPADSLPRAPEPREPSIKARLATFDAVAFYNETLLALAGGATTQTLERRLDALGGALDQAVAIGGAVAPGAGLALPPLLGGPIRAGFTELATTVEAALANAEARAALVENRALIDEAIDLLIADTAPVYDLYLAAQGSVASSAPGAPLSAEAAAEFARIAEFHTALGAYVVLLDQLSASHDRLHAALTESADPESQFNAAVEQAVEIGAAASAFRDAIGARER